MANTKGPAPELGRDGALCVSRSNRDSGPVAPFENWEGLLATNAQTLSPVLALMTWGSRRSDS